MKGGKKPLGYTIVEVMIVLAISGVMFLIASTFVSGRQQRTAFNQGVIELASRLQDTLEQVSNGQYSDIKMNCIFSGGTPLAPGNTTVNAGATNVGQNDQCVFLGKIMQFNEYTGSPSTAPSQYETFSVVGGRLYNGGNPITVLADADPKAAPLLTTHDAIPQGLDVKYVTVQDISGTTAKEYGLGFLQSMGIPGVGGTVKNSAQTVLLYHVPVWSASWPPVRPPLKTNAEAQADIDQAHAANLSQAKSASICVTDGTRFATVSLGVNDNQLNVETQFLGSTTC